MSRLIVPAVIAVVIAVAAGGYFLLASGSKTSSSSSSTLGSSSSQTGGSVRTDVNQFLVDLNTRNVDNMMTFYSTGAVDRWSGNTGGLSGLYTGTSDIQLIYATTVGSSRTLNANLTNYAEKTISPTVTNATFVVMLISNSSKAGIVTADINVTQEWHLTGSNWQIYKENWVYTLYDSTLVDKGLGSATTFPQWGYALKGGNPNLVSEKSFEWHAGPYLAGSVYAFLFGVLAFMAFRLSSSARAERPERRGS